VADFFFVSGFALEAIESDQISLADASLRGERANERARPQTLSALGRGQLPLLLFFVFFLLGAIRSACSYQFHMIFFSLSTGHDRIW
jgi:hypothetical protein